MYVLFVNLCYFHAGLRIRQAQTKEKAENNERQGKRMGTEEERADEKKRKCCACGH